MNYRRQRRKPPPAHIDDWLMTYADMITLLLCFFAIFLSVSIPRNNPDAQLQKPQPVIEIPPPTVFEGLLPLHGTPRTTAPTETEEEADVPPPQQKGDRITTMEMNSATFFESGSATLSPEGMVILADVSGTLKSDQYKNYTITIEGHTDDTPIDTLQFPSNWELSTARASAVVHFFLNQGIPAQKLRAAGYADTFPKAPNHDASGNPLPENQAGNRRVVIKLEKIEKAAP